MLNRNYLVILGLVLILSVSACFPPYKPVSQAESEEGGLHFSRLEVQEEPAFHDLFFAESGDPEKQLVLFIHGTPGSWQGYQYYLRAAELTSRAHLVAVDRPGFGESADGNWLPSFKDQAALLIKLQQLNHSGLPMVVVGHSLGGTIAYRMAVDFPEEIAGLVIISSSIDPDLGKARWYNRLASLGLVRWAVPGELSKANREIMPLFDELLAIQPLLADIESSISIIHGVKDALVDFGNLDYAEQHLTHARLKSVPVQDSGHFVIWEQPALIIQEIVNQLEPSPGN